MVLFFWTVLFFKIMWMWSSSYLVTMWRFFIWYILAVVLGRGFLIYILFRRWFTFSWTSIIIVFSMIPKFWWYIHICLCYNIIFSLYVFLYVLSQFYNGFYLYKFKKLYQTKIVFFYFFTINFIKLICLFIFFIYNEWKLWCTLFFFCLSLFNN